MTSCVIYYTRTNNTKIIAETIAKENNSKLIEIKDLKNRKGKIGFLRAVFDSNKNKKTDIKPSTLDLNDYDTIYIGSPVWASKPTPAINEIIKNSNIENKNIITFVTMKDEGKEAINKLNQIIKTKKGNITKSFTIKEDTPENMRKLTLKTLNEY